MDFTTQQLRSCELFAGIDAADIAKMKDCLSVRTREYAKGEFIWMAEEPAVGIGIVLCGSVHILSEDYWGNRAILAQIPAGGVFGEVFSCADVDKMPVSVLAVERSSVAFVDYKKMTTSCHNACAFHTAMIQNMMRLLAQKNLMLTEKLSILGKRSTREKLLSYLSEQAAKKGADAFTIPFNRQELADFLCVDRSAMSTELGRLRAEGILDYQKNQFRLY